MSAAVSSGTGVTGSGVAGSGATGSGDSGAAERVLFEAVAERLGISAATLRAWLPPAGGAYAPHEVDWLLAVRELAAGAVPARRIRGALEALRSRSNSGEPPGELHRVGSQLVVHDALGQWSAESGQEWLPLTSPASAGALRPGAAEVVDFCEARRHREERRAGEASRSENAVAPVRDDAASVGELYRAAAEAADAEEAIGLLREVVARDDGHVEARLDLGAVLHERGELADAERWYREALRLAPQNATAWFDLGVALEDRGEDRAALDAYRRSLELDGTDPDVWFNTSRLLERVGDRGGAIAHLARCRKLRQESDS